MRNEMDALLQEVAIAWGWTGLVPTQIVGQNAFGNLLLKGNDGRYWRIVPEELQHQIIAENDDQFARLFKDPGFIEDWEMARLVEIARATCGPLTEGRCYCLKAPGTLGGEYAPDNIATLLRVEAVRVSGHLAEQLHNQPDGATIKLSMLD